MAKLTKTDFNALAGIIRQAKTKCQDKYQSQIVCDLQSNLAHWLSGANPNFDSGRFNEACDK